MESIRIEGRPGPRIVVRFLSQPNDEEFAEYLREYSEVLTSGERYAVTYVTMPDAKFISHRQARLQALWMSENEAALRRVCAGVAFVLPSPIMRGVLRAIFKIQAIPVPYQVFRDELHAREWVDEYLSL